MERNRIDRFARTILRDTDTEVQSGLAMTPAEMYSMAEKGLPIKSQSLGIQYDQGYSKLDFDVPLEHRRGVDINDAFEARQNVKSKLRSLVKSGKFDNVKSVEA